MATVNLNELPNMERLFHKIFLRKLLSYFTNVPGSNFMFTSHVFDFFTFFIYLLNLTYFSHSHNSFDRNLKMYIAGNDPAREMFLTALPSRKTSFPDLPPLNWWKFDSQVHLAELWRKRRPKQSSQGWTKTHEYVAAFLYFIYGRALVCHWSGTGFIFG